MTGARKSILIGLMAVWGVCVMASVLVPMTQAAEGDSFARGMNRVATFFGFQIAAGITALVILLFRPLQGKGRIVTLAPIALAGLLILGVMAIIIFARLG